MPCLMPVESTPGAAATMAAWGITLPRISASPPRYKPWPVTAPSASRRERAGPCLSRPKTKCGCVVLMWPLETATIGTVCHPGRALCHCSNLINNKWVHRLVPCKLSAFSKSAPRCEDGGRLHAVLATTNGAAWTCGSGECWLPQPVHYSCWS